MKIKFFFIIIIYLSGVSVMSAQSRSDSTIVLPESINGWTPLQDDRTYTENDLYLYINGGAELYLSYGFQKVYNRIYGRENQPDIFVDIFFMNTSHDAFGVFTHSRESIEKDWGAGSQYSEGAILFWKGNCFVSILTNPETAEAKKTIFELAEIIDKSISSESILPPVIKRLPEEKLIEESIRYFRHHIWLNSFYFISTSNLLNISQDTEAVLAKYNFGNDRPLLVIIEYPDTTKAKESYNNFSNIFIPESEDNKPVQIEDGTYSVASIADKVIYIVFNAKDKNVAIELLDNATK